MDEEQIEAVHEAEEIPADPSTGSGIDAASARPRDRAGLSRWIRQFVIGMVVAGTLVFALGRRAELSSVVTLAQARRQMQNGHSFQAAQALEVANHQNPGDRAVRVALIEAYYRAGEPEQARKLQNQVVFTPEEEKRIQPLVEIVESTAEALQTGADLLREGQYVQALPLIQKAAKDLPDSPVPQAYLAKAYGGLYVTRLKPDDLEACRAAQRRLAEIDSGLAAQIQKPLSRLEVLPEVVKHTNAADEALKAGKTEAAIPELEAADRLYPNSAMVHALRAIVHAQRFEKTGSADEKRQALEEYQTAIQLNPTRASMRPRLGKLAKDAGD
jgi:tetratricopeptide (TPR) repeat protein